MDLHQQRLELRHALHRLLKTIELLGPHASVMRELHRVGVGGALVNAVNHAVNALEVTKHIPIK